MESNITQAFRIANCLDKARYLDLERELREKGHMVNYYKAPETIKNFSEADKAEYIILSHWITYICDRGMNSKRVWDTGGYIFSWLVYEYLSNDKFENLLFIGEGNNDDIIGSSKKEKLLKRYTCLEYYTIKESGTIKHKCRFIKNAAEDKKNDRVDKDSDGYIRFASRYIASDVVSVYRTLVNLKKIGGLKEYISEAMKNKWTDSDAMIKLLLCMYNLSYKNIGQYKVSADDGKKCIYPIDNLCSNCTNGFPPYPSAEDIEIFKNKGIFESKRAICALRDYFKHEEFISSFKVLINSDELENFENKKDRFEHLEEQLPLLELPGDVWNNKDSFGNCIREILKVGKDDRPLNRILRTVYDSHKSLLLTSGYPEQFDVTFDFVPRMCEKNACDICLFRELHKNGTKRPCFIKEKMMKYCYEDEKSKYCPILLKYCGYSVLCETARSKKACIFRLVNEV